MKLCAISFKECWQEDGKWYSYGGFPLQMNHLGAKFDSMTLVITEGDKRPGGILLPEFAKIVPLIKPKGNDGARKLYVIKHLKYYVKTISKEIKEADVVHTPLPGDIPLIAMIIALLKKKKLIARYGGSWENNDQTTITSKFTKFLMKRFAGGKRVMIATGSAPTPPSKRMYWHYSSAITNDNIKKIKPVTSDKLSDSPRFVYLGRLSVEKGVLVLIEAIKLLKDKQPSKKPKFVLYGGGPLESKMKQMVSEYSLEEYVSFEGQVPKEILHEKISDAEICIQPSLTESLSKAWIDAFSHGLPVLTTTIGAADSAIGTERGWLVKPGNPQALANKIYEIIEDDNLSLLEMRTNCRDFAEKRTINNWATTIKEICDKQWANI